jgi:hypothetical protein
MIARRLQVGPVDQQVGRVVLEVLDGAPREPRSKRAM